MADFVVREGESVPFSLAWYPSHTTDRVRNDPETALAATEAFWSKWSSRAQVSGLYAPAMTRSLVTLKALTYAPTGGIVAAPTTSLPELLGGVRNWDYRFCWLRDATFTLYALMQAGYFDEAVAWREWLLRAVAGKPSQLQTMYGLSGERHLTELELPWLEGYSGSRPVRIGNAASTQLQLDVWGEVMDALHLARRQHLTTEKATDTCWCVQLELVKYLETIWDQPDEGIWEVRGPRRHFTHSKVTSQLLSNLARARAAEEDPRRAYELRVAESLALSLEDTLDHMIGSVGRVA